MITKDRLVAIVVTLLVWGLAGALFGALFAGLHAALPAAGLSGWPVPLLAVAAAAMVTSAFYSAMSVALAGAMAGVLASIGALVALGNDPPLAPLAGAAALAGLVAGGFYGWMAQCGGRPLTLTLVGLTAGLCAGVPIAGLLALAGPGVGPFALAALAVALVGTLFQVAASRLGRAAPPFPSALAAGAVAAIVATLVAAGIWTLGATPLLGPDGATSDLLGQLRRQLPPGFLGGLCGGALAGLALELLGFRLEDHP